jgi:hypothetical protein
MGEKENKKDLKLDDNSDSIEMPYNLDNSPIKKITELQPGCFIELTVPFRPDYKIDPPLWEHHITDEEELAEYYQEEEARLPTHPANTAYLVTKIDYENKSLFITKAPLFSTAYEIDRTYMKHIISLPYRRVGRADFRSGGSFHGYTKMIGDYATEDLERSLQGRLPEHCEAPLRHKAMAQVDMIMADVERIFDVKRVDGQIFQLSLKVKESMAPSMLGPIYFNFIMSTVKRLMPPQVMIKVNELYKMYRLQPCLDNPEEDELLVILAVDFTLKDDYHYIGIEGFKWPI